MSECNKEVGTSSVDLDQHDDDHHCNASDNISKEQTQHEENAETIKEQDTCTKTEGFEQSENNDHHKNYTEMEEEMEEEEEEEEEEELESSEESMDETFDSDEAAERARADGLKEYNAGNYNAALDIQYKIVRYFERTYGAKAAESGKYFLDYGLSQLRVLQLESSIDAVLQPRDVKQMEACYVNLSMAREGLQKREQAISKRLHSLRQSLHTHNKHSHGGNHSSTNNTKQYEEKQKQEQEEELQSVFEQYVDVQLSIADVHNALAQLDVEIEDFDNALKEYEVELLLYRELQEEEELLNKEHKELEEKSSTHHIKGKIQEGSPERVNVNAHTITQTKELVPPQRIISTLYGIADCYMKEADYDNAEERLQMTLDEIRKYPAGTVAPELVEELQEFLEDAKEMKGGKYKEIQQTIQEQLAGEAERLPTAHEFYEVGKDDKHPFLSSLPDGHESMNEMNEGSHLSMPMSLTGNMLGFNEHSNTNSQSISHFPHQSNSQGFVMNGSSNTTNGHHPHLHHQCPPASETNHTNGVIGNANGNNAATDAGTNHTVQVIQARKKSKTVPHSTHVLSQPTSMQPSSTMNQQQHNSSNTESNVQDEEMHNVKRARVE